MTRLRAAAAVAVTVAESLELVLLWRPGLRLLNGAAWLVLETFNAAGAFLELVRMQYHLAFNWRWKGNAIWTETNKAARHG